MRQRLTKILLFGLLISSHLHAQESQDYKHYSKLYPNANSVRLNQETIVKIDLDSDGINITQKFLEEDLYLDNGASLGAKRSLRFSSFFELEKVEASTYSYNNGKYQEIEVTDFKEKDELDNSFYDDSKSLNFIFPNLKKGAKSVLEYSEKVKNPRFLSPFYFGDFSPIVNNKIVIVADKNINFKFKEFNTQDLDIKFNKQEKRNTIIYTWELKNIKKFKYEPKTPTYKKIFPHIVPIITSYKTKNEEVILANKVSDLYKWYYSLVKDINKENVDEELVTLVNGLTKDKPNDFEKVKAIYYWTQKNIKYIAFEYALGGFIPRQANDIFKKKYGDCKDNSSILFKMLEIAGLKGDLTWIGTRKIPYDYNEVPTPLVDNHMILSYTTKKDSTYFLDATGRFIPIDYPTPFIQGKEALISKGENFIIKKVPVIDAHKNAVIDTTFIYLEDQNIIGSSKINISGYKKVECYDNLEYTSTNEKTISYYNSQFRKGNNKFLIKNYNEINKFDYDKHFIVDYNFSINNYAKKLGNEIYVNLNLNKELLPYKMNKDRKYDIEYDYKSHFSYTTSLKIPEGYKVEYLPETTNISNNLLTSNISYITKKDTILYTHNVSLNFLTLNSQQQKKIDELIKPILSAYKEVVILKKS